MTEKYWTGDSLNAEKEALLGAVIGLCRAAESNMHRVSQNTDDILIKALCTLGAEDEKEMGLITDRVKKEKQRLAPGCAGCGSPCGRTEDASLRDVTAGEEAAVKAKTRLINKAVSTAKALDGGRVEQKGRTAAVAFLYRSVFAAGMKNRQADQIFATAGITGGEKI